MFKVMLVGATGMVGDAVVNNSGSGSMTILARRGPRDPYPQRHRSIVRPTEDWATIIAEDKPDILINCLGTTIRQAGSQAAFRAVDHDLVLAVAAATKQAGAAQMISVSSVGASAQSRNFYLKTKGETEGVLRNLGFDRLDLIRPGLLLGDRPGPPRLGEGIATIAAPFTDALLRGSLRRYRSIQGGVVAAAIAALVGQGGSGVHIHENDAIRALAD
ncbi:NAD-dependent epimerase/dehydratase family protein [Sphingopyxis sp.]|uniref:NAD-dependent epimerase/dehydratase family protein n=1 Tax=Sphingopyxis sp. TaxID=1908224 RepID=UPI003D152676